MSLEYNISILTSQLSLGKIDRIFALNEENVPNVGALNSIEVFKKIIQHSSYNLYVSNSKNIVGFIVCMRENSDYESENFRYFKQQENKFIYIDRIAIKKDFRRQGIGRAPYKKVYSVAHKNQIPVCCEVNTFPLNQPSIDFHKKEGFKIVGKKSFGKNKVAYFKKQTFNI